MSTEPELFRNFDYTYHDPHPSSHLDSGMTYRLPINLVTAGYVSTGNAHTSLISSNSGLVLNNGSYVGYQHVTETLVNRNDTNGRKEYIYSDFDFNIDYNHSNIYIDGGGPVPFPKTLKKQIKPTWRNGNLKALTYFDKNNNKIKKEIYEHESVNTLHRRGDAFAIQAYRMPDVTGAGNNIEVEYYGYTNEHHRLKSQTTIDYFDNNQVVTTTNYQYDNNPLLASKVSLVDSTNLINETHTLYAQDMPSPTLAEQKLINQNRFVPVETKTQVKNGNTLLSSQTQKTIYHNWDNDIVLPKQIKTSKNSSTLEDRIIYHRLDTHGNPLEVSKAGGIRIIYVWGYNNTQPIAKIENASYVGMSASMLNSITTVKNASNNDVNDATENTLRSMLANLRAIFSEAMVTAYTYDPLIGVTSITNPRGQTVYYKYDEFNRLQYVKDHDGNILSKNEYNYKN
ncbi:MAG: hypothetical protein GKR88_16465 [Flavobacteriaceae bacterium]|nr:MAG: hypothetical protein GKR88_16465 [Flavobacteriaceae bacterium]